MNNLIITEGSMRTFINQLKILEIAIAALADNEELHKAANQGNGTESVAYDLINGLPDQLTWMADVVRKLSENNGDIK